MRRVLVLGFLAPGASMAGCTSWTGGCTCGALEPTEQAEHYHWGMHRRDEGLRRMLWELEQIDHMLDEQIVRAR